MKVAIAKKKTNLASPHMVQDLFFNSEIKKNNHLVVKLKEKFDNYQPFLFSKDA